MYNKNSKLKTQNSNHKNINENGQSLLELVIVIAVMVVVIGALTFATIASLRNAQFSKNQAQATKLAQEGLEWVRTGRDRNKSISNLPSTQLGTFVTSWNGTGSNDAIWDYHISGSVDGTNCDYQPSTPPSRLCYLKILYDGSLLYITSSSTFPSLYSETPTGSTNFKRAITISDDLNDNKIFSDDDYKCAKKLSSIVYWHDFAGDHFSTLTTILSNPNPPGVCK